MKRAFITGVTGQDGAYLAEYLLRQQYQVYGGCRRSSSQTFWRLKELGVLDHERFSLIDHDLTDAGASVRAISQAKPDEVYNLGAQSFVRVSFDQPSTTAQISGLGAQNVMEAIRIVNPGIRMYQASSAEMFGKVQQTPQDESTPFYPRSPYGVAKLFAHWSAINYRESYDMFVSCGILFNHESPLRGPEFVTRKIALAAARIASGHREVLALGNMNARRDWGFSGDYVQGMHRMLQADSPDVFVMATGVNWSVREFTAWAFEAAGIDLVWEGEGVQEVARCARKGDVLVKVDPHHFRPAEVETLLGCPDYAEARLNWRPKVQAEQLAKLMVDADLARLSGSEPVLHPAALLAA